MPYDLIRRAGERLSGQSQQPAEAPSPPAPEPAAKTMPLDGAPGQRSEPVVSLHQPGGRFVPPPREPVPEPPVPPAETAHEPVVEPMPGRPHSRIITIDTGRLRRAGMVIPDGGGGRTLDEEFRLIKRPLLVKAFGPDRKARNPHLIMVASANAGEGKSFIAHNLALSMAGEANTRVLLVDADLRSPSAPHRFGFAAEAGLVDVLADERMDLADVMLRTNIGNLSILPAGKRDPRVTELLASARMGALMAEMARRYDDRVIIFDAPPVLGNSQASVLAMHVGQVLFVVEAEKTGRNAIEESLALLECCPDISFVLNKRRKWLVTEMAGAG